jgi:hypothetical protein
MDHELPCPQPRYTFTPAQLSHSVAVDNDPSGLLPFGVAMVVRFHPPPGWPPPPAGWLPQPDWRPDPAWPPAPPNWVFLIDDDRKPGDVPLSSSAVYVQNKRSTPTSTILLTAVAAVSTVSFIFTLAGLPALLLAIASIVSRKDVKRSRRLTRWGWTIEGYSQLIL